MLGRYMRADVSNLPNVIKCVKFGREPAMYTQELLVHDRRQRQTVKCIHARVVHFL